MTVPSLIYRLLITGSRDWALPHVIYNALAVRHRSIESPAILVSGACPTGADRMCEVVAESLSGWTVERHPADWVQFGKSAGFKRNAEMVGSDIDECLAFILNGSKGATHTARLAEEAGIKLTRFEINGLDPLNIRHINWPNHQCDVTIRR